MLTVSTESLAVLAAVLAANEHAHWLLDAALAPFLLGLGFYLFAISRFDIRQLAVGRGDHWITGGALAISTLAAGRITRAANSLGALHSAHVTLKDTSVVLWALTIAWLPALLAAEALRPRLGTDFARIWVWAAVAVWPITFTAMLRRGAQLAREQPRDPAPGSSDELAPG